MLAGHANPDVRTRMRRAGPPDRDSMRLTKKDSVGILLVAATFVALLVHTAPTAHQDSHRSPVADAGGAVTSDRSERTVVFYDVNVVAMDRNAVARRQVVVVRDGFITRIGPVGVVEPPAGIVVEGGGTRYLAPGLTDAHVHLGDDAEALLPLYLANGVTTVFNLEGSPRHVELRERVRSGRVPGPRIYTAGPFVNGAVVRSPADAERVVREQVRRGYDFVKLHGDLTGDSFEALTRAGRDEGIAVVGHAPRNLPLSAVLENRQVGVSHAEDLIYTRFMTLNPADLAPVARSMAEAGTWLTPGISMFENIADQWGSQARHDAILARPGAQFLPPSLRRDWAASRDYVDRDPDGRRRIEEMLDFHAPLVRTLHEAGVPLLAGTDAGVPGMVPGFSLQDEIAALHRIGLSSYEALAAATRNAGRFVSEHVDSSATFGTIREGARADLILLDRDPMSDLDALRRPAGVMVQGRWYDRATLDRMLAQIPSGG